MQQKIIEIKNNAKVELADVCSTKLLNDLKVKYLGKNGEVTALLKGMKDIPAENRAEFGKIINEKHFDRLLKLIDKDKVKIGGNFDKEKLSSK